MNDVAILWLFGSVIGVQVIVIGTLFKLIIGHINDCKAFNLLMARIDTNVNRIMGDLGDHERGIRGQLNEHQGILAEHSFRLDSLDKIVVGLR